MTSQGTRQDKVHPPASELLKQTRVRAGDRHHAAIAVIGRASAAGSYYRDNNLQPPFSDSKMQGNESLVAGHVAVKVAAVAPPDSRAYAIATAYIDRYPGAVAFADNTSSEEGVAKVE